MPDAAPQGDSLYVESKNNASSNVTKATQMWQRMVPCGGLWQWCVQVRGRGLTTDWSPCLRC